MSVQDKIVKTGKWYHEYTVPCLCHVVERGSGTVLYFVKFEAVGEPGNIAKEEGPFRTLTEAQNFARVNTNGTLRWN